MGRKKNEAQREDPDYAVWMEKFACKAFHSLILFTYNGRGIPQDPFVNYHQPNSLGKSSKPDLEQLPSTFVENLSGASNLA